MKNKIIFVVFMCLLMVLTTVDVVVVNGTKETILFKENLKIDDTSTTHTVLVEYGSLSTSSSCQSTTDQLFCMYASGEYDFQYVSLITDKNKAAEKRSQELGITKYPDVYFDGGYRHVSEEQNNFEAYINSLSDCDNRKKNIVEMDLEAVWAQCPCQQDIAIRINIYNGENFVYNGRLIVYIVEVESRWRDYNNKPYNYGVLDFAADKNITIESSPHGNFFSEYIWNPNQEGFPVIDISNMLVIASIFSESNNFADKTVISRLVEGDPPSKPNIPVGEIDGKIGEKYVYTTSSTDPERDEIRYGWDWDGDYTVDEWTKYYDSGEEVNVSHTWIKKGSYSVQVKAKDEKSLESFWSDPLQISIPKNKETNDSPIRLSDRFIERFQFLGKLTDLLERMLVDRIA